MLIQCGNCGRPVYTPGRAGMAECIYCYRQNPCLSGKIIRPDDLNWQDPMVSTALRFRKRRWAVEWLRLMGREQELNEIRAEWKEAEKHWGETLQAAEEAWKSCTNDRQIQQVILRLEDLPESSAVQEWIDRLEGKIQQILAERRISQLKERLEYTLSDAGLAEIEKGLEEAAWYPAAQEPLAEVRARREQIARRRAEAEAKAARSLKIKKRIRRLATLACVLAVTGYGLVSCTVLQPDLLQQARTYAKSQAYEQAEDSYTRLLGTVLFVNDAIRDAANRELKALRNEWAEKLAAEEQWEEAILLLEKTGKRIRAGEVRAAQGDALAAARRWKEAIECWRKVSGSEERIRQLYTEWIRDMIAEEDYRGAIDAYKYADPDALSSESFTMEWLYGEYGKQLEAQGKIRIAVSAYRNAGDAEWVRQRLEALRLLLVDEESERLLARWRETPEEDRQELIREMAETGRAFDDADQQLRYWKRLRSAGVDLTQVFPDGAQVRGFSVPASFAEAQEEDADLSRPLVLVRKEYGYSMGLAEPEEQHDPADENNYTLRLMPELWQQLPEDRRAETLADCTCILFADSRYVRNGSALCTVIMENYVEAMVREQTGKGKKGDYIPPIYSEKLFPVYTAVQTVWIWRYPEAEASRAARRTGRNQASSLTLDTRVKFMVGSAYEETGLCGSFDDEWIAEQLQQAYGMWR